MANTIPSPNMNLPVPVVGTDTGPDWAYNLNACLSVLDQHNHTLGSGVQITPSGLNINVDLPFNSNNATLLRTSRYVSWPAALVLSTDVSCVYVVAGNLYYNNGNGVPVQITSGNSVTGSAGTITGLPSGTASASYAAGTFTFQSATSTPATMSIGPLIIAQQVASSPTITITPSASQATNFDLTLPPSLPAGTALWQIDTSGNITNNVATGSGSAVLNNAPTFTGTATFQGQITANDGIHISAQGISITGGIALPDFTGNSWLLINGSNEVAGYRATKTLLATDSSGNSISSVTYFGNTQLSADTIVTVPVTGNGNITVTVPSDATKKIWVANTFDSNAGVERVNVTSSTTVLIQVFGFVSNCNVLLVGMQYTT